MIIDGCLCHFKLPNHVDLTKATCSAISNIKNSMTGIGSCLLWVMSTEISVDIAVDIGVDTRSIVGRHSVDIAVDSRSIVGR